MFASNSMDFIVYVVIIRNEFRSQLSSLFSIVYCIPYSIVLASDYYPAIGATNLSRYSLFMSVEQA